MTNQPDLRSLARERLTSGKLPICDTERLYAGRGSLSQCAVCLRPIEPQHVEYEIAAARDPSAWLHMHVPCYEAWQGECQRLSQERRPPHSAA